MLCLPEHCCHYGPSNMTIVEYACGHLLKPGPSSSKGGRHYPMDKSPSSGQRNRFPYTYPLNSDLSSG